MKSYEAETRQIARWSGEPIGHMFKLLSDAYYKGCRLVEAP